MAPSAPPTSKSARSGKKRSRNFDGCWTCRLRKIKCDCTRPTCVRCEKAKLECKGYSIVLAWAAPLVVDGDNQLVADEKLSGANSEKERLSSRRAVDLVYFPASMKYETYARLNSVVSQFEDVSQVLQKDPNFFVGPFGVFKKSSEKLEKSQVEMSSPESIRSKTSVQLQKEAVPMDFTEESSRDDLIEVSSPASPKKPAESPDPDRVEPETSIFSKTDNTYVHYALLDSAKLTTLAIKGPEYQFSEQSMFHILYPNFFPNVDPDDWKPSFDVLGRFFQPSSTSGGVLITPLLTTAMTEFGASSMAFTRVVYNDNQWDKYVVPFVKRILFELICEEFPKSNNWETHQIEDTETEVSRVHLIRNIRWGIMLMCLATTSYRQSSEFNKKAVQNDLKKYYMDEELKAAILMRKLGIYVLNYHLDEYDNNMSYPKVDSYETYLLMAMLLQINLDTLFGVYENYELIFAIGDFLVKNKFKKGDRRLTPLSKYLRDIFEILQVFYSSTQAVNFFNYQISEHDRQKHYQDLDENYDISKNIQDDESSESSSDESVDLEGNERKRDIQVAPSKSNSQKENPSFAVYFNSRSNRESKSSSRATDLTKRTAVERIINPVRPEVGDESVYVSYGLPKSLLQVLYEVVQLTNHKRVFETQNFFPRNFPKVCADTEDKLLNWRVENHWDLYESSYDPTTGKSKKIFHSPFHDGLYHNVMSVYHALKVYHRRLITRSKLSVNQGDIEACMNSLERVLRISEEAQRAHLPFSFSPSFWSLLVTGCDIDIIGNPQLQQRCRNLWSHNTFRRHNYWRSKQILFELWKRRSEGEEIGFMDLVREWAVILCLG